MESLTTLRTIQMSRKDANNFRLKCLVDRSDLACPGPIITLKDVSFGKAVKMIKTGTIEVLTPGTKNEWTHISNGDYDALVAAYTDKVATPVEPEVIVSEPKVEEVVEEKDEYVDEFDDEDTVDESDIEETIEGDTTEDEQEIEEVVEESDDVQEEDVIEETADVIETTENIVKEDSVEEVEHQEESPVVVEQPTVKTVSNNNQKYQYTYKKKKNKK